LEAGTLSHFFLAIKFRKTAAQDFSHSLQIASKAPTSLPFERQIFHGMLGFRPPGQQ
jgi:hypothetical protein